MTWARRSTRFALLIPLASLAVSCAVQLVAPYNAELSQTASAMQADVATWDLKMRAGAGTVADDPRNPAVSSVINTWHGQAEAMLTLALSNDPGTANCADSIRTMAGAIQTAIPAGLRSAAQSAGSGPKSANAGCEAGLVEQLQTGIADVEKALKFCQLPWVDDAYFAKSSVSPATVPTAPNEKTQRQRQTSCLAEFKADPNVPAAAASAQHGRAVSVLLTTLQSIVYVETRKKAAEASK
jgi:hypothetical protein